MEEEEEEGTKAWTRRVELSIFEGLDLQGWVSPAEKFFEVQNVTTKEIEVGFHKYERC